MAERRMFHTSVVEADSFLDLPVSSQALYFHLGMHADDDGFINGPRQIARSVGCDLTDLQRLVDSNFLLQFDDVVVVRHWRMANSLKSDRLQIPRYPDVARKIYLREDRIYTQVKPKGISNYWLERKKRLVATQKGDKNIKETKWNPTGIQMDSNGIPRREERKRKEKKRNEKKIEESSGEENCGVSGGDTPTSVTATPCHLLPGGEGFDAAATEKELKYMGGKLGKGVVLLSDEQMEDLLDKLGLDGFDHYVDKLSTFILKNEAKVKNHYATILRWWQEDRGVTYENKSFEGKSLQGVFPGGLPGEL